MKFKGFLCPIFSLPNEYGNGDFGKEAFFFVDILKKYHFTAWQLLPLNPISYGNSPYQPFSSYAFEEIYLDIEDFQKRGLLIGFSLENYKFKEERINYNKSKEVRHTIYKYAFKTYVEQNGFDELDKFLKKNKHIKEFAIFMAFKDKNNQLPFNKWKDTNYDDDFSYFYYYHAFLQMFLLKQYLKLKKYANQNGIKLIGDIPFYVGLDSSDVYFDKKYFLLNKDNTAKYIAGVAPDYFSKTGQRWGNPIYNFKTLKEDNYSFLIDRILYSSKMYDIIRLDHFRAFDSYYKIKGKEETAEHGKWVKGPGSAFFYELYRRKPNLKLIAEDLGDVTPSVFKLRDKFNLPGMNILEFNLIAIINNWVSYKPNTITYIGTHDNDTLVGYFNSLNKNDQNLILSYLKTDKDNVYKAIIRYLFKNYRYPIVSITDVLYLPSEYKINYPSTLNEANWSLKLKDFNILIKNLEELNND